MFERARFRFASLITISLAALAVGCQKEGADGGNEPPGADTLNVPGTTGQIVMSAAGPVLSKFTFDNSYASIREQPMGGVTRTTLTIEGHKLTPSVHVKLRFSRDDGELEVGNYSIERPTGEPPRKLDASFEHESMIFKPIEGSVGNAEITKLTENRVQGNYSIKLASLNTPGKTEAIVGTFDVRIQH